MLFGRFTRTLSLSEKSLSSGLTFPSSPIFDVASGTLPTSNPPVISNQPMAIVTTGPLTPLASISMLLILPKGGCIIVDSTRRGKRFPDSMSKTIPIWTCVLNRALRNYSRKMCENENIWRMETELDTNVAANTQLVSLDWDCSLHLPLWISKTERASIEDRLEQWTKQLEASGADVGSLALSLKKPLRPLWISQKTVIWLNEVPDCDSWDFTPIILVSASSSSSIFQQRTTSEFSWHYISGAGDDEESWARGLTPNLFWKHVYDLINSGPDVCNQKVADIVEKDRVYRSQRGQSAPQVTVKPRKLPVSNGHTDNEDKFLTSNSHISDEDSSLYSEISNRNTHVESFGESHAIYWLGSTNLAVGGTSQLAADVPNFDCILNCDNEWISTFLQDGELYLHLPMMTSKLDRFSLLNNLPSAVHFAKLNLRKGKTLLVCCHTGEDISICVCLAILTTLFDDRGTFDDGKSFNETCITKLEMRRRLVFLCKYAINARPSRGNLKQVFSFLNKGRVDSVL
uniref:tRNA A64-2'-O-ribosylphosphate transferase n=2 Tax=Nelumbo nucifera TaxID=4432 RepID=A0A822ZNU2_NELNU|nr:TPA_asm: hypothetical protein HUJ06_002826 [Nelumbo nucifera]